MIDGPAGALLGRHELRRAHHSSRPSHALFFATLVQLGNAEIQHLDERLAVLGPRNP